jgi:hypothetical protein
MSEIGSLTGVGHFGFGYVLGYIMMHIVLKIYGNQINTQLYAPFLPILAGVWAALPYLWDSNQDIYPLYLNIFLFYPLIHNNEWLAILFARPAFVAIVCGLLYGLIVLRYIRLVKYCRNYGWQENGEKDAR